MRICIFGSEIGLVKKGVFVGGAVVSAVRLSQALHSLGEEVFVFSSAPRGRPSKVYVFDWGVIVNKRVPGRYMSLPYLVLYGVISFYGLLRFCKRNKIQIINSHSGSIVLSIIPSIVGKLLKTPVIHTQYCEVSLDTTGISKFLNHFMIKICLNLPAKFVGISKNVYVSLLRFGIPTKKVEMIPPIVPSVNKSVSSGRRYRDILKFEKNDLLALFIGNLEKNKGIDALLEAFIKLANELPELKLIITTELAHKGFFKRKRILQEKLAHYSLADRVVWLSFVDDILSLIMEADVLIVPFLDLKGVSDYPLVVLEAMSVGTPVIATNVGGTREILGKENGIMIPPGDVDALCLAIKKILVSKQVNRRCIGSPLIRYFDACSVGRKYQKLYKLVISRNG